MKSTGIARRVDELGRIVLPIELRKTLGLKVGNALEVYVDGDRIVLRKYEPSCIFCGNYQEKMIHHRGKTVCPDCAREMTEL